MKYFKLLTTVLGLLGIVFFLVNCDNETKKPDKPLVENSFHAKPFPQDLGIPGFTFPTDSNTVNTWIRDNDQASIMNHGWGIWTGLTKETNQSYKGQSLRVFETWLTPGDIKSILDSQKVNSKFEEIHLLRELGDLEELRQFHGSSDNDVLGFVKYDPNAARYALDNKIFWKSTLDKMLSEQQGEKNTNRKIPNFPDKSITLKPVFTVLSSDDLVDGRYFPMKAWTGPPPADSTRYNTEGFGSDRWPNAFYIDIKNEGQGSGEYCNSGWTTDTKEISSKCAVEPSITYNVNDFIHFRIDEAYAKENKGSKVGDYAILLAMHVASRENTRWTWQSFWWSIDPDNPYLPSSKAIADARPAQLQGAPRHYGMTQAYSMVLPAQPEIGGESVGSSIYAFNPHLEAGFDNLTFIENYTAEELKNNDFKKIVAKVLSRKGIEINDVGVKTNCMSCHILASYDQNVNYKLGNDNGANAQLPYSANAYYSLEDSIFTDRLKLDFAWSVLGNLELNK